MRTFMQVFSSAEGLRLSFLWRWNMLSSMFFAEVKAVFTMARIKAVRGKGKEFFLNHLSCNDYYSEKEHVEGVWHGALANDFGLSEQKVQAKVFSLFQQNINPLTHGKLTQRTVAGEIRFYDFQCSAQKSVSVMALFDDWLVEAHRKSVDLAMRELERFAAVRIRDGANVNTQNHEITGKIVYAIFQHDASRLLDPQLHTHNVVCNVTRDANGQYKALENTEMCKAIRYCGRVYQNAMAIECRKLGYEIVESLDFRGNVNGFEIKGVSEELQERFSKRTRDIDEEIARQERNLGRALTAAERHDISLETRSFKLAETDSAAVRNHQLEQLSREEMELLQKLAQESFQREQRREENRSAEQAIDEVLPELFEQQSVLKTEQILAEVLTRNLGNISLAELQTALSKHPELRKLPENYIVPLAVMEAEQYALDAIERERGLYVPLNVHFRAFEGEKNRASQREAVQGILRSRDRFVLLRGVAGSGKTSTLKELARGLAQAPRVLAPTNSAVEVLKREGFPHSQTVAGFLLRPPEFNGLVIVDESGLNSLRDGVALLRLAEEKKFRILFVGDSLQHHAVNRGDFFRLLEEHSQIKRFSLTEILRQQKEEYRLGVKACADGNFAEAFERFDRNGFLHENGAGYLKMAARRFVGLYHRKDQVIAVALRRTGNAMRSRRKSVPICRWERLSKRRACSVRPASAEPDCGIRKPIIRSKP